MYPEARGKNQLEYPADSPYVISVGVIDSKGGVLSGYSKHNTCSLFNTSNSNKEQK